MSDDQRQEQPGQAGKGGQPWEAFGNYLRTQRQLAQLTLRQLAELTRVSNPYLSQIERGLHQPSVAVITALADALNLSAEELLAQAAGIRSRDDRHPDPDAAARTETAIRTDPQLSRAQKTALLAVYRSMVGEGDGPTAGEDVGSSVATEPGRAAT